MITFSNLKNVSKRNEQKNFYYFNVSKKVNKIQQKQDQIIPNILLMKVVKLSIIKIGVKYHKIIVIKI